MASQHGETLSVIEIEEGAISPKKLLGDLMATLMSDGFAVKTAIGHQALTITPTRSSSLLGRCRRGEASRARSRK